MYFAIESHQFATFGHLLDQMYNLRHRVFCEQLKWVSAEGGKERDIYDNLSPVYLLHTDENAEFLYAAARLMPTSGRTLLTDVFAETMPDAVAFQSPFVWEITRLCVDEELIRQHQPKRRMLDVLRMMLLAGMEFGYRNGVDTFLSNFDEARLRIWRRAGARIDIIGQCDDFSVPVMLGLTESGRDALEAVRERLGHHDRVLSRAPRLHSSITRVAA
ncbi:acyl-homoserine-lactone synthase [Acuticoccus sediminis]|nr:acyl-homoserine-lactone synthase [Acuticoccus sediminis]